MKKAILLLVAFISTVNFANFELFRVNGTYTGNVLSKAKTPAFTANSSPSTINVISQVIPPWQRVGDTFLGSVTVSNSKSL